MFKHIIKYAAERKDKKMMINSCIKSLNPYHAILVFNKHYFWRMKGLGIITCSRESALALKEASRNSASFLSFLIFSRSEQAAFRCSFPVFELETCSSCNKFSNLTKTSSTLSRVCKQKSNMFLKKGIKRSN